MAGTNAYRVHVGDECNTYLWLDIFDVASPEEAIAQAERVRYVVRRRDGDLWLMTDGSNGCTAPVQMCGCGDRVWPGTPIDTLIQSLTFWCSDEDII